MASGRRLPIGNGLELPVAEIQIRASRSGGPGGQHANKTESRIEAAFVVAESCTLSAAQKARVSARLGPVVTAVAQETRSQTRNRELALERLAQRLEQALRPTRRRRPTKPSRSSRRRVKEAKRQRSALKRTRQKPTGDNG